MDCAGQKGIENNIDPCHAGYTHRWSHPQFYQRRFRGERDGAMEMRLTETGLIAFSPPVATASDPPPEEKSVIVSFDLPDRVVVKLSMGYAAIIVMHFVPTAHNRSRLEFLVRNPMPFGPRIRWGRREPVIFKQDRRIMESSQPWYDADGVAVERIFGADCTRLTARRIVELAEQGRWEDKRSSLPQRRVVELRA